MFKEQPNFKQQSEIPKEVQEPIKKEEEKSKEGLMKRLRGKTSKLAKTLIVSSALSFGSPLFAEQQKDTPNENKDKKEQVDDKLEKEKHVLKPYIQAGANDDYEEYNTFHYREAFKGTPFYVDFIENKHRDGCTAYLGTRMESPGEHLIFSKHFFNIENREGDGIKEIKRLADNQWKMIFENSGLFSNEITGDYDLTFKQEQNRITINVKGKQIVNGKEWQEEMESIILYNEKPSMKFLNELLAKFGISSDKAHVEESKEEKDVVVLSIKAIRGESERILLSDGDIDKRDIYTFLVSIIKIGDRVEKKLSIEKYGHGTVDIYNRGGNISVLNDNFEFEL